MTEKEIKSHLKQYKRDASMYSTDIVCASGTDFMTNIARAQNQTIWELITTMMVLI